MNEDIMEVGRAKEPYSCVSISTVATLAQTIARLQEQLRISTKALKEYADPRIWEMDGFCYKDGDIASKALKEIEVVK